MDQLFKNNSLEEFKEVCEKIIHQMLEYKATDKENDNECLFCKKELFDIICQTSCNINAISNILQQAGYEDEKIKHLISILDKNKNELLYRIIIDHNSKQGETMGNIDWAVKFVCGISELKTLRYPVLELALTTYTDNAQKQRLYEMDKNLLARLIHILENV